MAKLTGDIKIISDLYNYTADEWDASRTNSLKCHEFVLNEQWNDAQKKMFEKDGRVPIVYNMILPRLHNLFGTEQLNRVSTRIRPRDKNEAGKADTLNGIYLNEWETNEGEYELQKAFATGLIMPIPGWVEVGIWFDELGYGHYSYKSANPFNIYPDPKFTDYKLRDCQYIIKEKWLTISQIEDLYGYKDEYSKAFGKDKKLWERMGDGIAGLFGGNDEQRRYIDQDGNKFKILEMQERIKVKKYLLMDTQSGQYVLTDKQEMNEKTQDGRHVYITEKYIENINIQTVHPAFNLELYNEPNKIECDMYDVIPYMSMDFNNVKSKNSSMVYALIDPQTNLNKREIQKTNYLDHAINSPIIADISDKEAVEEFQEKGNKPGFVWMTRNYRNPPHRMAPANISSDIWMDINDSVDKMNDISGINDTARGQSEYSNESGRLFAMKAERTGATINPYFNNLTKTRKMLAEYFLKTVKQVYGQTNRDVELSDVKGDKSRDIINLDVGGEIFNDISQFEGSVVIDETSYNITKLQENTQTKLVIFQLLGGNPELVDWDWMLSDSELPDIQKEIDHLQRVLGQNAELQARQTALGEDQAMLEQLAMEKQITEPAKPQVGGKK